MSSASRTRHSEGLQLEASNKARDKLKERRERDISVPKITENQGPGLIQNKFFVVIHLIRQIIGIT